MKYWVAKLAQRSKGMVEVVLGPEAPVAFASPRYRLTLGDAVLEFGDDVSSETLARVVRVLAGC